MKKELNTTLKMTKTNFSAKEFSNNLNKLYNILKSQMLSLDVDYCHIHKKKLLLDYEKYLIEETKSEARIIIAIMIREYLKNENIPFYVLGNLTSSYFAYLTHLHDVDTFKYCIEPEMCYGINKSTFSLDFHIPTTLEVQTTNILNNVLASEYVYDVCQYIEKTDNLYVIPYKKVFILDAHLREKTISIDVDGIMRKCLLFDDIRDQNEAVIINMICDINGDDYDNSNIDFDTIERIIEAEKERFIKRIDGFNVLNDDMVKNMANSIHNSYDLASLFAFLHNTYYEIKRPSRIDEIEEIIFKDDVFNYLLASGIESEQAFMITKDICTGKYTKLRNEVVENEIHYDERIKYENIIYLFPKGHALAVIIMLAHKRSKR